MYADNWKYLFDLAKKEYNIETPLTPKILSDPENCITRHLVYLYSMESFIYQDMNEAIRKKEVSKIKFYGAYAAALSYIIYSANQNRKTNKLKKTVTLYRGLKMNQEEIKKYKIGTKKHLIGYTSTSVDIQNALTFATCNLKPDMVPVLFEIKFCGAKGLFHLTDNFTAFPDENEVLIQDGLSYIVESNEELFADDSKASKIQLIRLKYSA